MDSIRPSHRRAHSLASLPFVLVALAMTASAAADALNVTGQVIDRDTAEPISDAYVFAAVPSTTRGADVRRFDHVELERTDDHGTFEFTASAATGAPFLTLAWWRSWFVEPRPPRYHVYHPNYGLVWGREADDGPVRITLSLRDAHLRQPHANAFCPSPRARSGAAETPEPPDDALHETIRREICPPADPTRYPNGQPRATGNLDERGRRRGLWRFFRADGSVQAEGHYDAGAATGDWVFYAAPEPRN